MKAIKAFLIQSICLLTFAVYGQIGVLTTTPESSAELDIVSGNKGILVPRIVLSSDLSSPSPVSSPVNGLLVFNTGSNQPTGFYYWNETSWELIKSPSAIDITGPGSSTDQAVVRFDGTSGKVIQNSVVTIDDVGNLSNVNGLTTDSIRITTNPAEGKILVSDASGNGTWESAPPVDIEKNDITIVPNANTLNFEGMIGVKDEGNYKATVIFYKNSVTKDVIQLSSSDSLNLNPLDTVNSIPWNIEQYRDEATFIHSNTTNPSRIQVKRTGIYELNWMLTAVNKNITRKTIRVRLKKNGSTYIPHVACYAFSYHYADNKISNKSSSILVELNANDYLEVVSNGQTSDGNLNMIPNENLLFMRLIREL
ncbi:MAG: hypothetical protein K9G67_05610 [Bacteroidales bacterium]|nr:hypothetical protein [Bacteroidales bacterium]MCF8343576.1 hypothetical protein [Bacteroidales bacterium]MCF8350244.1 hypothetical protein [Bacteroidales bacterium]MCF8375811.1 hypothetical protein [Bacteroidales bacterium]MCF8401737.1 hypothetical protein [Bacteroidales bacterium]